MSAPRPVLRRARAATTSTALPSLSALLTGAAVLAGCHEVECGETREDELRAHGTIAERLASQGEAGQSLRQVGIALGVLGHDESTRPVVAGAMPAVQPTPPQTPRPDPPPSARPVPGGVMRVGPTPPPGHGNVALHGDARARRPRRAR